MDRVKLSRKSPRGFGFPDDRKKSLEEFHTHVPRVISGDPRPILRVRTRVWMGRSCDVQLRVLTRKSGGRDH